MRCTECGQTIERPRATFALSMRTVHLCRDCFADNDVVRRHLADRIPLLRRVWLSEYGDVQQEEYTTDWMPPQPKSKSGRFTTIVRLDYIAEVSECVPWEEKHLILTDLLGEERYVWNTGGGWSTSRNDAYRQGNVNTGGLLAITATPGAMDGKRIRIRSVKPLVSQYGVDYYYADGETRNLGIVS